MNLKDIPIISDIVKTHLRKLKKIIKSLFIAKLPETL